MERENVFDKKRLSLLGLMSLIFAVAVIPLVNVRASSEKKTSVYLDPPRVASVTWTLGKQFDVTVNVDNVDDLFAWEVSLGWDANILDFVSWSEGPFMKLQPRGTYQVEDLDQTEHLGSIQIGSTTIGQYIGKSGSGILAYVTFQVKSSGSSGLDLYDTVLLDSQWNGQPDAGNMIPHSVGDGSFVNVGVPEAIIIYSPNIPVVDNPLVFDASNSYDSDGSIVRYGWDFGDGTVLSGKDAVVSHTYKKVGVYLVSLEVIDSAGLTNTVTQRIEIRELHDAAVISVFSTAVSVKAGEAITITVVVKNLGAVAETFDVKTFYAETEFGTKTVSALRPETTETLTFAWDTSGIPAGDYVIKAVAQTLPGETSVANNMRQGGAITLQSSGQPFPAILVLGGVGVITIVGVAFSLLRREKNGKSHPV